jgi:hypothetical protein
MPHRALQPPDVLQLDRMKALVSPARASAQAQGGTSSQRREFYCELCRKQFGTAATLETHVGTKKHKAKVRRCSMRVHIRPPKFSPAPRSDRLESTPTPRCGVSRRVNLPASVLRPVK